MKSKMCLFFNVISQFHAGTFIEFITKLPTQYLYTDTEANTQPHNVHIHSPSFCSFKEA